MKPYEYFNTKTSFRGHSRWIAMISGAALLASLSTFCGCLSRTPLHEQTFAFNTPVLLATNGPTADRVLGIRILRIAAPFDSRSLVYRTGEFSYERDPYAEFLDTPDEGLIVLICELLRGDGCFSSVVGPGNLSAAKPDTLVEININQFYGDVREPGNPSAVLAMQVMFFDATNGLPGKIILERNYSRRTPMKSATAAALMEGWTQALAEIYSEVGADFRNQEVESRTTERQDEEKMQK
jgi:cholesterol transport system auxiliary component